MCGIAGFWKPDAPSAGPGQWRSIAEAMAATLVSRGPDDADAWADPAAGIGLGFRRLAIVDLSSAGRQPMASRSGRYRLVFNGEIYNHRELREQVAAAGFPGPYRGHSDTEALLAAIETWGLEATLRRAVGMFAIALWDSREQMLTLARDRIGEKPLYYYWSRGLFLFGSEIKALRAHPDFNAGVNRNSLASYLRFGYVPTPYSIYNNVHKLTPGATLTISKPTLRFGVLPQPTSYWTPRQAVEYGKRSPFRGDPSEAVDELEKLLKQTLSQQMLADVPLGAFLSGGVDSSLIVALMQAQSARPIKTFSIGFHTEEFNEAPHAARVAKHLRTDHTELYVSPQEAMAVIPRLGDIYDEPFADSSQLPTILVSQLARRHVTVSLSGDGGDELFAGYTRYRSAAAFWRRLSWSPPPLRRLATDAILAAPAKMLDAGLFWLRPLLDRVGRPGPVGEKLHRIANAVGVGAFDELYLRLMSSWQQPNEVVIDGQEWSPILDASQLPPQLHRPHEQMLYWDLMNYLPDDILTKVDRAAMSVSLETRVPFLDHRIVEFAWRLPHSLKQRAGRSKWILRQLLEKYVPNELVDRPKMGFGVPMAQWLRGSLRDWAENLLDERQLASAGFFNPQRVRQAWREHLSGRHTRHSELWFVLMFQAWHERQAVTSFKSHVA